MAYIGNTPAENYVSIAAQHFTVSATASYSLNRVVTSENELALFINNVRQQPGSSYSYTATGTTLTLSVATLATDTMYCIFLGKSVGTIAPPDGSVGTATLATGAVTADKIADGTVVAAEIADGAVTDAKISAVATTKLTGTVTNAQVADLDAAKLTGTVADARLSTVTSSKLSGALPAVSGASLTGLTAGNITGVIPPANLGTGTASASTFLNGSGAYSEAGGGATTVIANTTVTATTNLNFTGLDAATYDNYEIWISNVAPDTDNVYLRMRTSTDGGSSFDSSGYAEATWILGANNTQNTLVSTNTNGMRFAMDSGNDATSNMSAKIFLHKPADTTYTDATWTTIWFDRTSGHVETGQGGGRRLSSADVDAIQFHWASGNFKAQGSIQLIGIKKA